MCHWPCPERFRIQGEGRAPGLRNLAEAKWDTRIDARNRVLRCRQPDWCSRSFLLLHPATSSVQPGRERGLDRQSDPGRPVSTVCYRGNGAPPRLRLLARLPLLEACLRRRRGLRTAVAEPAGQGRPHPGNHPRRCRTRIRLLRTAASQLVNGENLMTKVLAPVAFSLGLLTSSAALAGEKTVTLAVKNMYCAACPLTVRKSLEAVPGVTKAIVSYKDKTAVVTYDDTKTDVQALTNATTKAGYPSAPKG